MLVIAQILAAQAFKDKLRRKRLKINCGASAIASKIGAAQVRTSENDKLANPLISFLIARRKLCVTSISNTFHEQIKLKLRENL